MKKNVFWFFYLQINVLTSMVQYIVYLRCLMGCLHDPANFQQMYSKYIC